MEFGFLVIAYLEQNKTKQKMSPCQANLRNMPFHIHSPGETQFTLAL